jgi:hypothetical protein
MTGLAQSSRSEAIERKEQAVLAALRDLLPWQLPARAMEAPSKVRVQRCSNDRAKRTFAKTSRSACVDNWKWGVLLAG